MDRATLSETIEAISDDLATAARGLAGASRRLRQLAASLEVEDAERVDLDPVVLELVTKRLGPDNRNVLFDLALRFSPEERFTLADISDLTGEPVPSIRARLMNIGRSLRSMDTNLERLFDIEWEPDREANRYLWDMLAHKTILMQVKHHDVTPEHVLLADEAVTSKRLRDTQLALAKLGVTERSESK